MGALDASDTIAHISHRPMAITRLSNRSMNHANQIISCCPPPLSIVYFAYSTLPSDSIPSPRCRDEKYNTVVEIKSSIEYGSRGASAPHSAFHKCRVMRQ